MPFAGSSRQRFIDRRLPFPRRRVYAFPDGAPSSRMPKRAVGFRPAIASAVSEPRLNDLADQPLDTDDPGPAERHNRRVTAADVARAAGVSRVAVSRAFTKGASVAAETRARVFEVASELGYRPNALARQLNRRSPELVAFIGGSRGNQYYSELIDHLLPALQQLGHRVLYVHIQDDRDLARALSDVSEYPVACTVVATGSLDEALLRRSRAFGPMVVSGPLHELSGVDIVRFDSAGGVALAVDHLLARGHRRIGCISGPQTNPSGMERTALFRDRLAEQGLDPAVVMHTDFTVAGGEAAARRLLAEGSMPDALFCGNDVIAIGVLNAIRGEARLRVPEDVAIVGFDDITSAAWPLIDLTTVVNPVETRARHVCDLVARRIATPDAPPLEIVVPARLVVRSTT